MRQSSLSDNLSFIARRSRQHQSTKMEPFYLHDSTWASILLAVLTTGALAQNASSGNTELGRICASSDIVNMNVANCDCPSNFPPLTQGCQGSSQHCTRTSSVDHQCCTRSTTYLVPGILQLHEIPQYWEGFNFAQDFVQNSYKNAGTLTLNSVASRTEEQTHVHLCNNPHSAIRGVLDGLDRSAVNTEA